MEDITRVSSWWIVVAIVITVLVCSAVTSCNTTGQLGDDGRLALRTIGKLEEQLASVDRRLEDITGRAETIEGDLGHLEQCLRIYVDAVRAMRTILIEYEAEAAGQGNKVEETDDNTHNSGGPGDRG